MIAILDRKVEMKFGDIIHGVVVGEPDWIHKLLVYQLDENAQEAIRQKLENDSEENN